MKEDKIMYKRKSTVTIFARGGSYYCTVGGHYGGGFDGARAGETAEAAAIFALLQEQRYIKNNPLGGTMIAPIEVQKELDRLRAAGKVENKKFTVPLAPKEMTPLLNLFQRVDCTLYKICIIYVNGGSMTRGDAEAHCNGLIEAGNLVHFLQVEALKALLAL